MRPSPVNGISITLKNLAPEAEQSVTVAVRQSDATGESVFVVCRGGQVLREGIDYEVRAGKQPSAQVQFERPPRARGQVAQWKRERRSFGASR